MSEADALKLAVSVLFAGIRAARKVMPDPERPARVVLDAAYRMAERYLEPHNIVVIDLEDVA